MSEEKKGIHLIPTMDSFTEVMAYIEEQMEQAEISMRMSHKICIAVDEIYSNIVHYSGAEWAQILCDPEGESIVVVFEDNGVQYNPLEKDEPDVTANAEEREIGGLGIFMTKQLMDDVRYSYKNGINKLELVLNK